MDERAPSSPIAVFSVSARPTMAKRMRTIFGRDWKMGYLFVLPMALFMLGLIFWLVGFFLGLPVFLEYLDTHAVRRFPTAILCTGLGVTGVVSFATGLILDLVAHVRREAKLLAYLMYPAPRQKPAMVSVPREHRQQRS